MPTTKKDLLSLPAGPLQGANRDIACEFLYEHWESLDGSSIESTTADKLHRAEDLTWKPPILSFTLERHGGTVNQSSRADLHFWEVNVDTLHAAIVRESYRQLQPLDKRLNTKKLAQDVAKRILAGEQHETLQWKDAQTVSLKIAALIPETNQQTTASRRRKFYDDLEQTLKPEGWIKAGTGRWIRFVRSPQDN
jgi:hypothetical protein